jgi:hypothetical protein
MFGKNNFGSNEDENDMYNFAYDNNIQASISPFSPVDYNRNEIDDKSKKAIAKVTNITVNANESALERAQNMLNKYSNKSFSAAQSNFKKPKNIDFDEDDISIESNEIENSQSNYEESDSMEDFKHKTKSKEKLKPKSKVLFYLLLKSKKSCFLLFVIIINK